MLAPYQNQRLLIRKLFSTAKIVDIPLISDVIDLYDRQFDLLIALEVFDGVSDVDTSLRNLLKSCRYLWLQDRVDDSSISSSDVVRFKYLPLVVSSVPRAYDLSPLDDRMLNFTVYPSGRGFTHFMAFFLGDNCAP